MLKTTYTEAEWLALLDPLPLECDGLSRVLSMLLTRDGVSHRVCAGVLTVRGHGTIPVHWWITLSDGRICDLRARMWIGCGDAVPHGVFVPQPCHIYNAEQVSAPEGVAVSLLVFAVLAGRPLDAFPPWPGVSHAKV